MATLSTTITYSEPVGSLVATLGAPGPSGQAATIAVGTTTTGAPGTDAAVLNVGTSSAAIFDFTIPRGNTGAQGQQGIQGIPGQKGDKGDTGDAATVDAGSTTTGAPGSSASVVNVGTSSAAVFDFTIPRGDKGDKGDQGNQGVPGPAGVVYADAPLSYNSGTQTISIDLTAYLPKAGGYITGDIQSINGSGYRTWNGAADSAVLAPSYLQFNKTGTGGSALTIESSGITFPSGKQTVHYPGASILNGYATESWVTTQLGSYLTISSAAINYYPLTSNPSGFISDAPSDGTIYGRKDGSWVTASAGGAVWGSVTGYLPDQTDLQNALDAKYDASNPAGFITSGALSGYATESWVQSQGYLTSVPPVVLTNLTTSVNWDAYDTTSTLFIDGLIVTDGFTSARLNFGATLPNQPNNGDFWFDGTNFRYGQGGAKTLASQNWVTSNFYPLLSNPAGYITSSALTGYAQLSGATFTGKVVTTATATSAPVNIAVATTAPTTTVAGDIWVGTNNLFFKDSTNTQRVVINQNTTNTFSSPQIVDTTSNTLPALRITQKGTQPALVVEDALNPDPNATVIDQNGNLGVGVDAASWTAANKVEVVGAVKAQSITFDGTAQFKVNSVTSHSTGANTHDLYISFGGSTYRIPMIFVSTP